MRINRSKNNLTCFIYLLLTCLSPIIIRAQAITNEGLKGSLTAISTISKNMPVEKVYLQFDKPYYTIGDTIRFKSYLLNGDFLTLSNHSGLLYIELDDKYNRSVKRVLVPIVSGTSWGDIALSDKDIPEGSYTLRAYTNWMRNFNEDYVFKKSFYISAATEQSLLVNTAFKLNNNNVQANLQFTNLNKQPVSSQLQLQVTDEKKNLYKTNATPTADGRVEINFPLPDKTDVRHLYIIATETSTGSSGRSAVIPVAISRPENTTITFTPEGGSLVAGLPAHIGFKAIGENGRGRDVSGAIFNSKQQQVATFKSTYNGIGSFDLTPEAGESYTAKVASENVNVSYKLPAVNASGTTLRVSQKGNDSLEVVLNGTSGLSDSYYLIGQARGVVCYAAAVNFKGGLIKRNVAKGLFPSGVSSFTLLSAAHMPLNERLVYVDHQDNLRINISSNKPNYTTRDSVGYNLQVNDKTGIPIKGSFSVAVTDNGQVKADSLGDNLANYLLLTSDLKDEIENPGYYFAKNTPDRVTALDNLLITQSPTGYNWKAIFDPKIQPTYTAEQEFTIQGKLTNLLNKPVAKTDLLLLSKKPAIVLATTSDDNGNFVFKGLAPVDTAIFLIQAKNKNGNTKNVGIEVNEFKAPVFTETPVRQTPWYVNSDTVLLNSTRAQIARQAEQLGGKGRQLKEVKIKGTKVVPQSKNLNGPGEADQVLNEEDMLKLGKITLRDILQQKVKGFTTGQVPYPPDHLGRTHADDPKYRISYKINEKEIRFIFDGMDLDYFYFPPELSMGEGQRRGAPKPAYNALSEDWKRNVDTYLDYFTADEIKGIEVMYNAQYNSSYANKYLNISQAAAANVSDRYAYIEITTRTGQGPFAKKTPGTLVYRPMPFTLSKKMFKPKYTARNNTADIATDLRSTIDWEPSIITDAGGKARFSFYSADKPGSYTVTVEGIDLNGDPGYQTQKVKVMGK